MRFEYQCVHSHAVEYRGPEMTKPHRRDKFVELAEKRTANAIRAIRRIAKLGNLAHYTYSESDVQKIVSALNKETETMRTKMTSSGGQDTIDFKL